MNRKPTRQSRGADSSEKKLMSWIKSEGVCHACGNNNGVYVHHMYGATWKAEKMHLGHLAVIGLCQICDNIITRGSRRAFVEAFGLQSQLWLKMINSYPLRHEIGDAEIQAIIEYGK